MAVLAVAALGAWIAPVGYAGVGWAVGSLVGNALFGKDISSVSEGPRIDSLKVQSSTYGRDIPVTYGAIRIAGNIIWSAGIEEERHEETQSQGGKGGPEISSTSVTYTYSASFATSLCEGEIGGVARIWADSNLIYDASSGATAETVYSSKQLSDNINIYTGSETQEVDPLIESHEGIGNVPGFRGSAYIVFENMQLADYGNRIPNITAEVFKSATATANNTLTEVESGVHYGRNGNPGLGRPLIWGFDDGLIRIGKWNTTTIDSWDLNGNYIGTVPQKQSEQNFPTSKPVGMMNEYYVQWFGNLSIAIGQGVKLLPVSTDGTSDGFIADLVTPLPAGEFVGGCAISPDGNHAIVFTSPSGGSDDKWYIVNFNGSSVSLVRSGTLAVPIQILAFGSVSVIHFRTIALENDLEHFWTAYGVDGLVRLYTIDSDDVASFVNVDEMSPRNFSFPSIYALDGMCVTVCEDKLYVYTRDNLYTSVATPLSSVVSDICLKTGLVAGDIDVTALTDTVDGYASNREAPARGVIEPLQQAFLFDVVESDNKIVFVNRGTGTSITINEDDLGASDGSHRDKITRTRMNEMELPRKLSIAHLNNAADYQENIETASRLITDSVNVNTISIPISMSATKAAQLANILLGRAWIERDQYAGFLPFEYIKANPSDILLSIIDGVIHTILLTEVSYQIPGIVQFRGVAEDTAQYNSTAVGASGGFTPQVAAIAGPTNIEYLDIPLLRDQDNSNGYYVAASGYLDGWSASNIYKSNDGGDTWLNLTTIIRPSAMGIASDALADGIHTIFDYSNTVNVRMSSGTLSSTTEANVLNFANACLLGNEIFNFVTATLESDGSYTLSGLLRGRKGTEWAMGSHAIGDRFILLDDSTLFTIAQDVDEIGTERDFKAVTIGSTLQGTSSESFTNNAVRLEPLSPVHIAGSRDSSDNLTITWIRRARVAAGWRDYVDVALDEATESYEVDIVSASPEVVARTIAITAETASYTAAEQTTDGFTPGDPVNVNVYQLSATVGRGYVGKATI